MSSISKSTSLHNGAYRAYNQSLATHQRISEPLITLSIKLNDAAQQELKLYRNQIDHRDARGDTLLHHACINEDVETVQTLLANGANPLIKNDRGNMPLHLACYRNNRTIVDLLLKHGANVNSPCHYTKECPLHIVNEPSLTEFLIQMGADIDALNQYDNTPLYKAINNKQIEKAKILIENGANVNLQNTMGQAPLHLVNDPDLAKLLIDRKANVDILDNEGNTPLHLACLQTYAVGLVKALLEAGANRYVENKKKETPFTIVDRRKNEVLDQHSRGRPISPPDEDMQVDSLFALLDFYCLPENEETNTINF